MTTYTLNRWQIEIPDDISRDEGEITITQLVPTVTVRGTFSIAYIEGWRDDPATAPAWVLSSTVAQRQAFRSVLQRAAECIRSRRRSMRTWHQGAET